MDEEDRQPWERMPDESADQYQAFCDYRVMRKGSARVLWSRYREAANRGEHPPSTRFRTLMQWSSDHDWVRRRAAWLDFQAECEAESASQEARKIGERQARDAAKLQNAAIAVLDQLGGYDEASGTFVISPERFSAIDISRLWKTGFEAERALAGEASVVVERKVRDLSELSDDELAALAGE